MSDAVLFMVCFFTLFLLFAPIIVRSILSRWIGFGPSHFAASLHDRHAPGWAFASARVAPIAVLAFRLGHVCGQVILSCVHLGWVQAGVPRAN